MNFMFNFWDIKLNVRLLQIFHLGQTRDLWKITAVGIFWRKKMH